MFLSQGSCKWAHRRSGNVSLRKRYILRARHTVCQLALEYRRQVLKRQKGHWMFFFCESLINSFMESFGLKSFMWWPSLAYIKKKPYIKFKMKSKTLVWIKIWSLLKSAPQNKKDLTFWIVWIHAVHILVLRKKKHPIVLWVFSDIKLVILSSLHEWHHAYRPHSFNNSLKHQPNTVGSTLTCHKVRPISDQTYSKGNKKTSVFLIP